MPKTDLPFSLLEALQKPNAAFLVERSLRGQFYKLAYGNYSLDDFYSGRFEVTSADFDTFDDVLLQAFFNFTAANTRAIAEGREQDPSEIWSSPHHLLGQRGGLEVCHGSDSILAL